ncbi:aldehyde dehydrogenase family protein [Chlorobium phaeobacteroides]|uniref:Aldehyde dehydrogenase n=1 Tax=Chlorobium phaeobacteroides (strain DSM 266 / SMG 266 / 2430) TaxID=290317 RepID=A1BID6_CHLPD|nr:aldehyde dehydrogenase family protein [Chlorobium phaeobacteroides]ABL66163.1 aldehyde dehydrogenase [Chlorobium phaeobacteroides DSM 266]
MERHTITETLQRLRETFRTGRTVSFAWRRSQLLALRQFLLEQEAIIAEAVTLDFGKSAAETFLTETEFLRGEIESALRNLKRWMKPERVHVPLHYQFGRASVRREPFGVVLVIGAWNYPLNLSLVPLVSAVAAGNCVLVKPSELAFHTSKVIANGISRYMDNGALAVFEGGVEDTVLLLKERFDCVFFTGSQRAGREVMLAAARHLTPVILELGGKSPCIVHNDASLGVAARRIVWAKFLNAGQTCIAPDYLLVHRDAEEELLLLMQKAIVSFYGTNPELSPDYPRIISDTHFTRLEELLKDGLPVTGGDVHKESRYIAPAILRDVNPEAPIMQSEIFGPLLPVLTYTSLDEALAFVRKGNDPLAVYLFSASASVRHKVLDATRSGGFCTNDLLFQSAVHGLPFGGVGQSGFGRYHGRAGYEAFSYVRSILYRSVFPDPDIRYPPYAGKKFSLLQRLVSFFR